MPMCHFIPSHEHGHDRCNASRSRVQHLAMPRVFRFCAARSHAMRMGCSLIADHWLHASAGAIPRWHCCIAFVNTSSKINWAVHAQSRRQHDPMADPCQQSREAVAVSHPVASAQDQAAWEDALNQQQPQGEIHQEANQAADWDADQLTASTLLVTSHPAVGASAAECSEWEEALAGTFRSASDPPDAGQGVYAVVECGSHSTRLLLSTGSTDILRLTRDTHLGTLLRGQQQEQPQQERSPDAAAGTLAAVQEYKQLIDQHQQQLRSVVAVATAAVREAAEGPSVAAAISTVLGCPVKVLTGELLRPQLTLDCSRQQQNARCYILLNMHPAWKPAFKCSDLLAVQVEAARDTLIILYAYFLCIRCCLVFILHVRTGDQEAQLAFKGATAGLSMNSSAGSDHSACACLVLDLGGRSTELAIGGWSGGA